MVEMACLPGSHSSTKLFCRLIDHYKDFLTVVYIISFGGDKRYYDSIKQCTKLEVLLVNSRGVNDDKTTEKDILFALENKQLKAFLIEDLTINGTLELCKQHASTLTQIFADDWGTNFRYCHRPFEVNFSDAFWRLSNIFPTMPPTFVDRLATIPGLPTRITSLHVRYSFSEFTNRLMPKYRKRIAAIPKLFQNLSHLLLKPEFGDEPMEEETARMLIKEFLNQPTEQSRIVKVSIRMPESQLPWNMMEAGECQRIEKNPNDGNRAECTRIIKGMVTVIFKNDMKKVLKVFHSAGL